MPESTAVLVVGAGPVGLSAALALRQAGIDVRVIDAGLGIDQRMRASTFHPPTLDMIDELGLGASLIDQGLKVPVWQMRRHPSGEHVDFDLTELGDVTRHPYRLQVEQHRYCSLLQSALGDLDVNVEFNSPLASVTQDATSVTAHLASSKQIESDWLIAADGATSAVRGSLGLSYGGKTYTHSSVLVLTDFPFHEHLDELADVTYCWSQRGPFSLLRLKGLWRASLYPGVEDLNVAAEEERVRDWLEFITPAARDAKLLNISPYKVHERCVDRFRVGRVCFAGDAAHLNPPSGGMGMNGGIHDAMNLATKLIAVLGGEADSLLDRYHRQRHYAASERVIPQAAANRARMAATEADSQVRKLNRYQAILDDQEMRRDFLLSGSMISLLQAANDIE